jgi:ribosomal protein L11 methyltransferase
MYFCLDLENVSDEAEGWLSHYSFDWGAQGVSEVLSFHQEEGEEAVATVATDIHHLHVYFDKCPDPQFMQELKSRFPEVRLRLEEEADRDWLAEWKKGFHPFKLVDGIFVVPSWLKPPEGAKQIIWMEPGMAFGTGTHETTQLVSEALYSLKNENWKSVLDVGTGTGILGILSKLLGAERVVGIDTDPEALRVAKENVEQNKSDVQIDSRDLVALDENFDVILANIIDGILIRIQEALFARAQRPGWVILSGILEEREEHFLEHFHLPAGASWFARAQKGDWVCHVVKLKDV